MQLQLRCHIDLSEFEFEGIASASVDSDSEYLVIVVGQTLKCYSLFSKTALWEAECPCAPESLKINRMLSLVAVFGWDEEHGFATCLAFYNLQSGKEQKVLFSRADAVAAYFIEGTNDFFIGLSHYTLERVSTTSWHPEKPQHFERELTISPSGRLATLGICAPKIVSLIDGRVLCDRLECSGTELLSHLVFSLDDARLLLVPERSTDEIQRPAVVISLATLQIESEIEPSLPIYAALQLPGATEVMLTGGAAPLVLVLRRVGVTSGCLHVFNCKTREYFGLTPALPVGISSLPGESRSLVSVRKGGFSSAGGVCLVMASSDCVLVYDLVDAPPRARSTLATDLLVLPLALLVPRRARA